MHLWAGSIVLFLWLTLKSLSLPAKRSLPAERPWGQSEDPAWEEAKSQEEEAQAAATLGFRGSHSKAVVVSSEAEGSPERFPPHWRFAEIGGRPLSSWPQSTFQRWLHGSTEESVCHVRLDGGSFLGPNHLEVVGLLSSYDSGFLKALSRSAWSREDLEVFGMCPSSSSPSLLLSLQRVADYLGSPGGNRFMLLHLEEVKWEVETKLRFKLTSQKDMDNFLSNLQFALLIFYQGEKNLGDHSLPKQFLMGGEGLPQKQVVCLSRGTRYLVLQGSVLSGRHSPGELSYELSLEIKYQNPTDTPVPSDEAQDLLFGFDAKCFTRRTPAVLLMGKQMSTDASNPPASFLAADGQLEVIPHLQPSGLLDSGTINTSSSEASTLANPKNASGPVLVSTGLFLESLSLFVHEVLNPSEEPAPGPQVHLRLDFDTIELLPHLLLNLSEKVVLEQLVQSEDHLVVLFPENNQAFTEHYLGHWYLEGRLLWQLMEKLHSVIQELKAMPSFQANANLFQKLLAFCHYPVSGSEGAAGRGAGETEETKTRRKIHSLLLLKVLQVVRARWREARKVSMRANRSTPTHNDYCHLQELTINLVSTRYILMPETYNARNCVGPCRSPLSTRIPDFYSHTVFLQHMHEKGIPVERAPCCVPEKYSQTHLFMLTSDQGIILRVYPDMVAESCGCR